MLDLLTPLSPCGSGLALIKRRGNLWEQSVLAQATDQSTLFVTGDVRANENLALSTLHTLFMREHNRLVDEFTAAAANFEQKIARHAPRFVAFLGKAAYCALSRQREIAWGLQPTTFGTATVWVLPNPSGRNLAFSQEQLVAAYRQLYLATHEGQPSTA